MSSAVPPPGKGTMGCTLREGDPTEPPEPPSRWDNPWVFVGSIVAFWVVVLAIIFGALAVFG